MARQQQTAQFHKSKTLGNKYMLGDEIGKGAYGRVYKGLDLENGDFVAIKQVASVESITSEINIIMQEIDLLKNLNHKNIVKYLGSLKTKTHLHIILEYVENGSLANIIKPNKFGPFPESLAAVYIAQVLEGLVYLHEQGVIHRDIKGANILTTKEGVVKLADFGVATKLNEADLNTQSLVGTPYWMAPEVIEMSGVCAASDIWSVGCTVIELLTCVPPYYDLQPMPALFRIVQDVHPPIPDGLSPDVTDFLSQCFKKDAMQRPDAKTLLLHPWIQNSRHVLQSCREANKSIRDIDEDHATADDNVDDNSGGSSSAKVGAPGLEREGSQKEFPVTNPVERIESNEDNAKFNFPQDTYSEGACKFKDGMLSVKDPTLVFHEKPSSMSAATEAVVGNLADAKKPSHDEMVTNGVVKYQESRVENLVVATHEREGSSTGGESSLFSFGPGIRNFSFQKVGTPPVVNGEPEVGRFSDNPGDASLDDLSRPVERTSGDHGAEASTSANSQGIMLLYDRGKNDLAKEIKARVAQKHMENETGQRNDGKFLEIVMDAMREDIIDIHSSAFGDNLHSNSLFHLQSVEFSKLVGLLKPEESEDIILQACQKLIEFFSQHPEQKHAFMSQHGFLPLMELLEVPKTRVCYSKPLLVVKTA